MISLTASQHLTLTTIRGAGKVGASFDELRLGDALALALDDLVRPDRRQRRVFITERGEAFLNRVTA